MIDIHIFGLSRKEAEEMENRIFKVIKRDRENLLRDTVVTIHEKTIARDYKKLNRRYLLIMSNYLDDARNLAESLKSLVCIEIKTGRIEDFFPAEIPR